MNKRLNLKSKQGSFIMNVPINTPTLGLEALHMRPNMRQILIPAPCIHNQVNVIILHLRYHRVINGAALLVGENGQRPRPGRQPGDVGDDELLQEGHAVPPLEAQPAHVRHIEEATVGAAVQGGVDDGVLVLDGHAPPGERHHLSAVLDVEVVQGRLLELRLAGEETPSASGGLSGEAAAEGLPELAQSASHCRRRHQNPKKEKKVFDKMPQRAQSGRCQANMDRFGALV